MVQFVSHDDRRRTEKDRRGTPCCGDRFPRSRGQVVGGKLPASIIESVSAFANVSGGTVVLGLSEKEGFEPPEGFDAHRMLDALAGVCADKLTPPVRADIRIAAFEGASVLVADVPETAPSSKPCYITERGMSVSHCITRLRFKLKDVGRADTGTLEKTKGVITVINANGQYQVVVGNDVVNIYDAVLAVGGLEGAGETDLDGNPLPEGGEKRKSEGPASVLIDLISGIIQPALPMLSAPGILKGVLVLLTFLGWVSATDGLYMVTERI